MKKQIIFEPDLDERRLDGYYFARGECKNCDNPSGNLYDIDIMIIRGMEIPTEKFKCPNCGCQTLEIN